MAIGLMASSAKNPERDLYEALQVADAIQQNLEDKSRRRIFEYFREYKRLQQQEDGPEQHQQQNVGDQQHLQEDRPEERQQQKVEPLYFQEDEGRAGSSAALDTASGAAEEVGVGATNEGTGAEVCERLYTVTIDLRGRNSREGA